MDTAVFMLEALFGMSHLMNNPHSLAHFTHLLEDING